MRHDNRAGRLDTAKSNPFDVHLYYEALVVKYMRKDLGMKWSILGFQDYEDLENTLGVIVNSKEID